MAASPYAFTVGGQTFFDPHSGACCWCGKASCTNKQLVVLQRLTARVLHGIGPRRFFLRGNRGGGKSVLCRKGLCHALAMALAGLKYAVVRRNLPDLHKNHLMYLGKEMRTLGGSFHETRHEAKYENGSLGFYAQCEEEKDVEKIVGSEAAILFVDEAPQIKWQYLRTMAPSLRVPELEDGTQPYYTLEVYGGNPIGESIEELDRYFIDKDVSPDEDPDYDPNDWECIDVSLQDNPSLNPHEYRKQFAGLPEHYRKAWLDGERIESRQMFSVHKTVSHSLMLHLGGTPRETPLPDAMLGRPYHYIQELPTISGVPLLKVPWVQIHRAYDHGFFPDPAAALWFAIYGRHICAFAEGTWFKEIAKDLAGKIVEQTSELIGSHPVVGTYADPEIAIQKGHDIVTIQDVFELNGVPMECSIADRVMYGDAIHSLLGEEVEPGVPRFTIYEPGCPMLAKYLPKMRFDEKNPRKLADHKMDHHPVALAFFALSSGVLSFTEATIEQQRPIWLDWINESRKRGRRFA